MKNQQPTEEQIQAITAFMDCVLGFSPDIVLKAWEDNPHLSTHIQQKFISASKNLTEPMAIIPYLWTTLSTGNREILIKYILEHHNR